MVVVVRCPPNPPLPAGDDFNYEEAQGYFVNLDRLINATNALQPGGVEGGKYNVFYSSPTQVCAISSPGDKRALVLVDSDLLKLMVIVPSCTRYYLFPRCSYLRTRAVRGLQADQRHVLPTAHRRPDALRGWPPLLLGRLLHQPRRVSAACYFVACYLCYRRVERVSNFLLLEFIIIFLLFPPPCSLKGYIRTMTGVQTAARQMQVIAGGAPDLGPSNPLYTLERALGVAQHHDAVAGTSKQVRPMNKRIGVN